MQTNEELIIRIKNGEKTLENDLYNNVKGLIYQTSCAINKLIDIFGANRII